VKSALGFGLLVLAICAAIFATVIALLFAIPADGATMEDGKYCPPERLFGYSEGSSTTWSCVPAIPWSPPERDAGAPADPDGGLSYYEGGLIRMSDGSGSIRLAEPSWTQITTTDGDDLLITWGKGNKSHQADLRDLLRTVDRLKREVREMKANAKGARP
jgi:hypothetical protein